jgi:hypothetical protein
MDWSKVLKDYFVPVLLTALLLGSQLLMWKMLQAEKAANQRREDSWALERERLLNRMSSGDWQTYMQLQSSMQTSTGPVSVQSDGPIGLGTDETELLRSGYPTPDQLDFDLSALTGGDGGSTYAEPTIGADG